MVGPQYLRYLELNLDRISDAGQLWGNGRDSIPSDCLYFIPHKNPERALQDAVYPSD